MDQDGFPKDVNVWMGIDSKVYIRGNIYAEDGVFNGTVYATDGIFKGVIQASSYLDSSGKNMMTNGKWNPEYLNIKGLTVEAANVTGTLTIGQLPNTVAQTSDIPQKLSQLVNDSGYQTASGVTTIIGGVVTTDYVNALGIQVKAANVTGTLSANQIDLTGAITFNDLSRAVQNDINDTYTMAEDAQSLATGVDDTVSGWTYSGTTYIDGSMLMTGTVMASSLQGGEVLLLDANEYVAGSLTLEGATSFAGRKIVIESGGIELNSTWGDIYAGHGNGRTYLHLADYEFTIGHADVLPNVGANYNLGSMNQTWLNVYAETDTIQTSDRNKKHDIQDIPDKYLQMLLLLPPKIFKMNSGTSDRFHVGYIAQDVENAMGKVGIDSLEFAGFVKDKDNDGNDVYMLRYGEFMAIHTMAIQKIFQKLEAAGL